MRRSSSRWHEYLVPGEAFSSAKAVNVLVWLLFLSLFATGTVYNQPRFDLDLLGQALVFLSAGAAFSLSLLLLPRTQVVLWSLPLLVCLRLLNETELFAQLYLIALASLFLVCGYAIASQVGSSIIWCVLFLTVANLFIVLAQVSGLHSTLYLWNAQVAPFNEQSISGPLKTLGVEAELLLGLGVEQGRPTGLFASSQMLTLFVLFSASVTLMAKGRVATLTATLVGVVAALTLAVGAIFGLLVYGILVAALMKQRRVCALALSLATTASFWIYRTAFPGLVESWFGARRILASFMIRGEDLLQASGINMSFVDLQASNEMLWGAISEVQAHAARSAVERSSTSLFHEIFSNHFLLAFIAVGLVVFAVKLARSSSPNRLSLTMVLFFGPIVSAAVANVGFAPWYWLWVGLSAGFILSGTLSSCKADPYLSARERQQRR